MHCPTPANTGHVCPCHAYDPLVDMSCSCTYSHLAHLLQHGEAQTNVNLCHVLCPTQAMGWQPHSRTNIMAPSSCSSPASSPCRDHQQHGKVLSHVLQQLQDRDQELVALTAQLDALRAREQQWSRGQAAAVTQQQVAALQEAERQVQQLASMVGVGCGVGAQALLCMIGKARLHVHCFESRFLSL